MKVIFCTSDPKCNIVAFRGVTRVYMSIAPKDDKTKYIRYEEGSNDAGIIMVPSPESKEDENTKRVYVVEFFGDSEPTVLSTDEFVLSSVDEKDMF